MTIRFPILAMCMFSLFLCRPGLAAEPAARDIAAAKQERCEIAGTMAAMNQCLAGELRESDARLNLVYRGLMHSLARPQRLQQAQRAWLAFRDAECSFQNEAMEGATGHGYATGLCILGLTEQRIEALEQVQPCNGCVEFKPEFSSYGGRPYRVPPR